MLFGHVNAKKHALHISSKWPPRGGSVMGQGRQMVSVLEAQTGKRDPFCLGDL